MLSLIHIYAIEGYTTKGAWEMTDMFNLKAIEVIARSLRGAVANTPEGREGMALGQYLTGMGFSNCGLGIVHSMAHALGAVYDTPHGVANAILLPTVMAVSYTHLVSRDKFSHKLMVLFLVLVVVLGLLANNRGLILSLIHI